MFRRIAILTLILLAATAAFAADEHSFKFDKATSLEISMSAGGYQIFPADTDTILVTTDRKPGEVKVTLQRNGSAGYLEIDGPDNIKVTITVPRKLNASGTLSAGKLEVMEAFEGDMDFRVRAGDLSLWGVQRDNYRTAEANVYSGKLEAEPFGVNTGGLLRSMDKSGKGKWRLYARVMAGKLTVSANERKQ